MQQKATGYRPTSFGQAMLERASSACHPTGAMEVAARTLLVEPRSTDNEKVWATVVSKFLPEGHTAVSAAAGAAVLAGATEVEEGRAPRWCLKEECVLQMTFDVIFSRSVLSGSGNYSQRFAHLQATIHTDIEREEFGWGMEKLWRKIVDEPGPFPPEL